jgi:hypothetical protein
MAPTTCGPESTNNVGTLEFPLTSAAPRPDELADRRARRLCAMIEVNDRQ